jgi:hypothetical protein
MDPLRKLKETIGLPTEGHVPLIEPSKIAVDRDLIRAFHEHTLEKKEVHVVASLIATYRAWYDANLDVTRELAGAPAKKPEIMEGENRSDDGNQGFE